MTTACDRPCRLSTLCATMAGNGAGNTYLDTSGCHTDETTIPKVVIQTQVAQETRPPGLGSTTGNRIETSIPPCHDVGNNGIRDSASVNIPIESSEPVGEFSFRSHEPLLLESNGHGCDFGRLPGSQWSVPGSPCSPVCDPPPGAFQPSENHISSLGNQSASRNSSSHAVRLPTSPHQHFSRESFYDFLSRDILPDAAPPHHHRHWNRTDSWVETLRGRYRAHKPQDKLCFYLSLCIISTLGIFETIHDCLSSAYTGPIDISPFSLIFWTLSWSKEFSLAVILVFTFWKYVILEHYILVHTLLFLLLLVEILEDKWVSPKVRDMRKHYLLIQENLMHIGVGHQDMHAVRTRVKRYQGRIRCLLWIFIGTEASLLLLTFLPCVFLKATVCHWHTVHIIICAVCVVDCLATLLLYIRHYRYIDPDLLRGRFVKEGGNDDDEATGVTWAARHLPQRPPIGHVNEDHGGNNDDDDDDDDDEGIIYMAPIDTTPLSLMTEREEFSNQRPHLFTSGQS